MARLSVEKVALAIMWLGAMTLLASCGGGGGGGDGGSSPGFSIALSTDSLTIAPGSSGQTVLTISPYGGFGGTVSIRLLNAPEGITVSPQTVVVFGGSSLQQALTVRVADSVAEGQYNTLLQASSASFGASRTLLVTVRRGGGTPDFALRVDPSSLQLSPGSSGQTTLTITPLNGFNGTVALTLLNAPSGVSLTPNSVNVTGGAPVQQPLTINVASGVAPRQYTLTLQGSSAGITRTVTLDLTVTTANAFTVNTTADSVDIAPGDGVCADANGNCSLRAAVMEANARRSGMTITMPAGTYQLTLPVTSNDEQGGDLDLKADMTLRGAGQNQTILVSAQPDRVVQVAAGIRVTIESLTIRAGNASYGGGVRCEGNLTMRNCNLTECSAFHGGAGVHISTTGNLTMDGCNVERNSGWGLYNEGVLTMRNCLVSSNTYSGLYNSGGRAEAQRCTFSANGGDGIYNQGTVSLIDCTLHGNSGDGIENRNVSSLTGCTISANGSRGIHNYNGTLNALNCTVSGNARSGIYIEGSGSTTRLAFCTVFGNQSPDWWIAGGIDGSAELRGVIVAGNSGRQISGRIISRGYNLISDTDGITWSPAPEPTDVLNADPLLQPLADNGGHTRTHMPAAGSPALDKVPPSECTDLEGRPVSKDQRGVNRPQGGAADIGAVERS